MSQRGSALLKFAQRTRKNGPEQPEEAMWFPPVDILAKANWPFDKCDKWVLNTYEG
jgi:hypothetical protein